MFEILPLLHCLLPYISQTTLNQLSVIIIALLTMSGRVTMLSISRWAGKGGSYRTIQRFFYTTICWPNLLWVFFRHHCWRRDDTYLLVGDEVVVTKAGKQTHGLGRFFSSLYKRPVPGLAFFSLSLVSIEQRHSFPVRIEQVMRPSPPPANATPPQTKPTAKKRGRGRPKGSKNKDKTAVRLNRELLHIKGMLTALFDLINGAIAPTYLALDGHFGNNYALQMTRQMGLHLVSKLRYDSALYLPYQGSNRQRKYGEKLNPRQMPKQFLCECYSDKGIQTEIYQAQVRHKEFAQLLNVVIIVKTHLQSQAQAHVILFTSDLELSYQKVIDYYSLRFQIEFNFRDAKQFWGLEDFMNTTETAVTNAVNLSFFMVNLSYRLLRDCHQDNSEFSLIDLKACFRGYKYVEEVWKLLPQKPDPISWAQILVKVSNLGAVHPRQTAETSY
jgi:putative transposase